MPTVLNPPPTVAPLFKPFTVGSLQLPNRIVMAPMTRESSPGGVPGPDVARYYARRAAHGVGLIITEGTVVDHPASSTSDSVPRFYGADALRGWARVVDAVHAAGGKVAPQLWHVGLDPLLWQGAPGETRRALPAGTSPVSPSGLDPYGTVGLPMTEADIADVISSFARAAGEARRLGFDAIELHGAHGYLIDQFFWPVTNRRDDRYGGNTARRVRFCADIIRACRESTGPGFPISLRISQWKVGQYNARIADTPQELEEFLVPLVDAGVSLFHCSTRRFWQPEFSDSPLNLAGWAKKITGLPAITVGSVGLRDSDFLTYLVGGGAEPDTVDTLASRLSAGEFDLVAVGRALIADPAWPQKIRTGRMEGLTGFSAEMLETLA